MSALEDEKTWILETHAPLVFKEYQAKMSGFRLIFGGLFLFALVFFCFVLYPYVFISSDGYDVANKIYGIKTEMETAERLSEHADRLSELSDGLSSELAIVSPDYQIALDIIDEIIIVYNNINSELDSVLFDASELEERVSSMQSVSAEQTQLDNDIAQLAYDFIRVQQVLGYELTQIQGALEKDLKNSQNRLEKEAKRINDGLEKIYERLDKIATPFGSIPLTLDESVLLFPVLLALGFWFAASRLSAGVRLRREWHGLYQKTMPKGVDREGEKIALVAPIWFDPVNPQWWRFFPRFLALIIPILVFVAACVFNIHNWSIWNSSLDLGIALPLCVDSDTDFSLCVDSVPAFSLCVNLNQDTSPNGDSALQCFLSNPFPRAGLLNQWVVGVLYVFSLALFLYSFWQLGKEIRRYADTQSGRQTDSVQSSEEHAVVGARPPQQD